MNAIAEKLHLLETVAPNDALLASMLDKVLGAVTSKRQSGRLMGSFDGERLMPGDTIVVPEDFDRTTRTKTLKDWCQILYQFGLGAAALKVITQKSLN